MVPFGTGGHERVKFFFKIVGYSSIVFLVNCYGIFVRAVPSRSL